MKKVLFAAATLFVAATRGHGDDAGPGAEGRPYRAEAAGSGEGWTDKTGGEGGRSPRITRRW